MHPLPGPSRRLLSATLLVAMGLGLTGSPGAADGLGPALREAATRGEASFHTEVPPKSWRALEIKNLPTGTVVHATVRASVEIDVAFVRQRELGRYPKGSPLFRGRVREKLDFTVVVPDAGDWELVLDNRAGGTFVIVDIDVEAARPGERPAREEKAPAEEGI